MAQFDRVTASNTRWAELFQDPMVERQRAQEGLPNGTAQAPMPQASTAK
jgi:hypothetical protein